MTNADPKIVTALLIVAIAGATSSVAGPRPNECGVRPAIESRAEPRRTKEEVMPIAVKAIQAAGHNLAEYEVPTFCLNSKSREWLVRFGRRAVKGERPGKPLDVVIHDAREEVRVVPGA